MPGLRVIGLPAPFCHNLSIDTGILTPSSDRDSEGDIRLFCIGGSRHKEVAKTIGRREDKMKRDARIYVSMDTLMSQVNWPDRCPVMGDTIIAVQAQLNEDRVKNQALVSQAP